MLSYRRRTAIAILATCATLAVNAPASAQPVGQPSPTPCAVGLPGIHDRHGAASFSIARDSVFVPGRANVGRSRPKLASATVTVTDGISDVTARMQCLRGLGGFGPVRSR